MEYIDVIAGLIRDGQKEGAFRKDINSRVVARSLFGALDAILLTWALGEADPPSLRKAASHCASLFLEGLRVR
jgi:TetR/AcrR family fatty acid metabolism transcriptional regulator